MKKWLWLALFGCGVANADMLDALQAYEKQQFAEAKREFEQLLPLGNELAAFNLGAMAYQGEGQQPDLTKAIAYFMLAAELQHPNANNTLAVLDKGLTPQQRDDAGKIFQQLKDDIVIAKLTQQEAPILTELKPIKRVSPKYPRNAAENAQIGYVRLRILVNENGSVATINVLESHPEKVFDKASIRAVEKWQFETTEKMQLGEIQLNYFLSGTKYHQVVEETLQNNNLWQFAVMGSPLHQMALGMMLELGASQSGNSFEVDRSLPLGDEMPDLSAFAERPKVTIDAGGFYGMAYLDVNAEGVVVAESDVKPDPQSTENSLVGMKLSGEIKADRYFFSQRYADKDIAAIRQLQPVIKVPASLTADFWLETSARNGNIHAQRIMAARSYKWENYMLSQKDAEVMAWTGTRLILEGQREQGMLLLDQAIAQNYQPAKEMKQQFM